MGVRILHDEYDDVAIMYSSSTDWAFGPVFMKDDADHTASERAQAFSDWLGKRDPRQFEDHQLETLYTEWKQQEAAQWKEKEKDNDD